MLNELQSLSVALSSRGMEAESWHPWVKPLRKGPALVAELDEASYPARVVSVPDEQGAELRLIARDNHNSFPAFNLDCPLLGTDGVPIYAVTQYKRIARLMREFAVGELAPLLRDRGGTLASAEALLSRMQLAMPVPEEFIRRLAGAIGEAAHNGAIASALADEILYGRPNRRTGGRDDWKATLLLDVFDWQRFSHRVNDPACAREWSAALIEAENARKGSEGQSLCPLSGQLDHPVREKMPNPNLPLLGLTYLLSMNSDRPCQARYGMTSTGVFPCGQGTAQRLTDTIQFVTHRDRQGTTWTGVPNPFRDKKDLLIAYLEELPNAEVPVVGLFGDEEPQETEVLAYESRTGQIVRALRATEASVPILHVRVVVLTEIDKGRKQVAYSSLFTSRAVFEGCAFWIAGCRNLPELRLLGRTDGPGGIAGRQRVPSPGEVMRSFRRQWIRGGTESVKVPGVELSRVYAVFLDPTSGPLAFGLLDRYVKLTQSLLLGIGNSIESSVKKGRSEPIRREGLLATAVYGLLLSRLGRSKETYMLGRDYVLGQFLQLADLLHRLYCIHERKGSIPPQLIGNAVLPMAIQRPRRAFEVLATRIAVYLAWAERFSGPEAGLAKWTKRELGRTAAMLQGTDLDERVSTSGKAELLLGYLARIDRSNTKEEPQK